MPRFAMSSSDVAGQVTERASPGGVRERCIALDRMPGGSYRPEDTAIEQTLCAIDFHGGDFALCPKVFSTSPGTLVYDLVGGRYAGDAAGFEREQCAGNGVSRRDAHGDPVSYKMSVNTQETSATYANAALIYYHFARYFDTAIDVPVAVLRTMDRGEHRRRVADRGAARSAGRAALRMNHAGWLALQRGDQDPTSYRPSDELFTPDGQVYGVLLHPTGRRYGTEINGTRASGWGDGQNRDFQQTAPFRAVRSELPLEAAIDAGLDAARGDPRLAKDLRAGVSRAQMVFWMRELTEIVLLDFLFSQQDRVGNVDYLPYWYWLEDGEVARREASGTTPSADLADRSPILLKRTELGDNDAGVRVSYMNYAKRTKMLEGWRHMSASTYQKLQQLAADFAGEGPLHEYVRTTFGLSDREFAQLASNLASAAATLRSACEAGRLQFDLEPLEYLRTGRVDAREVSCSP